VRLQTDLDQKDNAARFVELLTHERAEVYIAAAWGLRQLAVEDSLADVLKVAIQRYDSASTSGTALEIDEQISHLCYYFGQHAYKPAVPFLTRFIPKSYDLVISRATAIWAFGVIYKGDPNRQIADQLIGRLNDVNPQVPETPSVRRFSALTLARMNARFALPALREFRDLEGVNSEVGQACAYAIKMLTGEDFELPKPAISYYQNFFLEPLPRN
jgi:hypothetical protein